MEASIVERLGSCSLDGDKACIDLVTDQLDHLSLASLARCSSGVHSYVQPGLRRRLATAREELKAEAGRSSYELNLYQRRPSAIEEAAARVVAALADLPAGAGSDTAAAGAAASAASAAAAAAASAASASVYAVGPPRTASTMNPSVMPPGEEEEKQTSCACVLL